MKISYKWLKDYVHADISVEEIDELLTFSGLEVEGVEKVESIKGGLEHVVIAQVLTCIDHPNSDHLHLTTVDVGGERPLNIVCGAPNVAAGQKVVCAQIGTQIWTSETEFYEIKKGKLRGEVSEGMLCAYDELQLGASHDGIIVLPDDAPVGMPAKEYFHVEEDYVIEVAITANRGDATSHIGVARDLVAVLNTRRNANIQIQYPQLAQLPQVGSTPVTVEVVNPELAPRYSGLLLTGIKVQPSPEWLQNRLRMVGIRPINNVVDVTNYVLMEVGQPMHAFDAATVKGNKVVVKCLPQNTPFVTLDGVERKLNDFDLMICNAEEPMCIAGVFGGEKSGVTDQTTSIFLESAYFDAASVRKTSKYHGLKTDASFRYERGCDPNVTVWALQRAAHLLHEVAGATVASDLVDIYPTPIQPKAVELNFRRVFDLVGKEIPLDTIRTALLSLDIQIADETPEGMTVLIPTCKSEVTRECDVVEEIMRIYGYNNIEISDRVSSCLSYGAKPNPRRMQNVVSDYLSDNGFYEIMNNSLTKSEYYENNNDFPITQAVRILNPLSKELNVMRQTLLFGGMESIVRNINYKLNNLKMYEFGNVYKLNPDYQPTDDGSVDVKKKYNEEKHLSIFLTGAQVPENWKLGEQASDFYCLKAYVVNILRRMRVDINRMQIVPTTATYFVEGLDFVLNNGKTLCTVGTLSKALLKQMDCKQQVQYADINWSLILKYYPANNIEYTEVAKYPEVRRDLALVVDKSVTFAEMEKVARNTEKKLLQRVSLFDVYEGKGVPEGMKSYAISFILQDKDKTLTDKQIDAVMEKLQKNFKNQLNAQIRS